MAIKNDDVIIIIQGYRVIVSACDAERVSAYKWYKRSKKDEIYFERHTPEAYCKASKKYHKEYGRIA